MCEANVELLERVQSVIVRAEANEGTRGFALQLQRALGSMRRYPLPLRRVSDLRGLSGVNEGTAEYLARLAEDIYGPPAPPELPEPPGAAAVGAPAEAPEGGGGARGAARARARAAPRVAKVRSYTPRYGSGGYALMLALHDAGALGPASGLAKDALILRATPYSDTPFTASTQTGGRGFRRGGPGNPAACFTYTAWNSMKTIMGKGLVAKQRKVFFLTPPGAELAARLKGLGNASAVEGTEYVPTTTRTAAAATVPGGTTTTMTTTFGTTCRPFSDSTMQTGVPARSTGDLLCAQCQSVLVAGARFCHVCGCAARERAAGPPTTPVALLATEPILPDVHSSGQVVAQPPEEKEKEKEKEKGVHEMNVGEEAREAVRLRPEDISGVVLLLDVREVGSRRDRSYFETHLRQLGCPCETRNLRLGDFVWVARTRGGAEYMLDHIIERKTFGDLCSSVRTEHLEDQRQRLHQCPCARRTVLVESAVVAADAPYAEHKFSRQAFMSALASTQFVHGFRVRTTLSIDDTVRYLAATTRTLAALVRAPHTLARALARPLTTYAQFDGAARPRALRVQDVFATQLLQLRRMPVDAALAVSAAYGNALALWRRYQREDDARARSALLQDLAATDTRRVGAKTSSNVAALFTCTDYDGAALSTQG